MRGTFSDIFTVTGKKVQKRGKYVEFYLCAKMKTHESEAENK